MKKIVILDDHPSIIAILESTVNKINPNIQCISFLETKKAIAHCENDVPDFVISDIQIDELKTFDFCKYCSKAKIPFMVYTSFLNLTIYNTLKKLSCRSYVSKSTTLAELELGIKALIENKQFLCKHVVKYLNNILEQKEIPFIEFTEVELPVILAQISGETTIELANRLNKSAATIRNQRINLAMRYGCTMEEIARRYLFWYTAG